MKRIEISGEHIGDLRRYFKELLNGCLKRYIIKK